MSSVAFAPNREFFPDRIVELPLALRGLEPALVWSAFATLLNVPRNSKHESLVSDALIRYAERRGFEYQKDDAGNVVIRKPGRGLGVDASILGVQGHMDMVCEATKDSRHDFCKDPIKPVSLKAKFRGVVADAIGADGTTLGADNGIGLGMGIALLEDETLTDCPPLEIICTVDEETGLHGARRIGKGMITAANLINLDSEELGEVCRSCAGSFEFLSTFQFKRIEVPTNFIPLRVS